MAALKDIKRKIGAVKKTQQITRAMNMVAAARLRGAQTRMENFRPYAAKYAEVMNGLADRIEQRDIHPFLIQPAEVKTVAVIAFSSDRGLCGSFNMNTISAVERFVKQKSQEGVEVLLTLVGRKLRDYFRRRKVNIEKSYTDLMSAFDYYAASDLAREAMNGFITGKFQEVYLFYTRFESMARQNVTQLKLLPIAPPAEEADDETTSQPAAPTREYLFEPSVEGIMMELLPRSVIIQVYNAMLETSTSEHAARMAAMDNATKNCKDMITDLTLAYNKARQSAITAELMDIVGGAEALRSM